MDLNILSLRQNNNTTHTYHKVDSQKKKMDTSSLEKNNLQIQFQKEKWLLYSYYK